MTDSFDKPYCSACEARMLSVLKGVEGPTLEQIAETKGCTLFKKGQPIFQEGSIPDGLYCIHEGKVKVFKVKTYCNDIAFFSNIDQVIGTLTGFNIRAWCPVFSQFIHTLPR